ncbi:hypothetical protein A6V36_24140 [Paraburkholderia ginsengiterrae]|uniref:Uncharacterized protein n=1 Tax=Paraburkholderia ginsengiterrae TaxID=1462993 RepID=A0A1A9N9D5_9BURK|nr:hypothetical protein [Paraburkholderia ginsengiterrae]OAJ61469.1 hypothetical protein A6V36_24140 [Paraburkholderia ginsengiterrae]OAJ62872.1 hypothetical protein A6V37_21920 [Paraburkholderia ginsengiterrae]
MTKINGPLVGGTSTSGETPAAGAGVAGVKPSKLAKGGALDALQDVQKPRTASSFRTSAKALLTQGAQVLSGSGQKPGMSNGPRADNVPPGPQFQGPGADPLQRQMQRQRFMGALQEVNNGAMNLLEKSAENFAKVMSKAAEATEEASRKV